ncbi:MAG: aminotransferase class I/II-fold pyridoxal phosphate-dependent enzyme [Selenomonadaceae bacterium]|nr:aminotransferase class I/II-fold pyridoxal phosphate-dependent enzyme [Selenomonadaceae bacterium]
MTEKTYEAMERYGRDVRAAFHTPGHKMGLGAHERLRRLLTEEGLRQEVNVTDALDDLNSPTGAIKDAEEFAAKLYGADRSLFMVNGTTGAIQTMVLGALKDGDLLIAPRNAHRSVFGAAALAGIDIAYMSPEINEDFQIIEEVRTETVRKAIEEHPTAKAVLIISPTYYGRFSDIEGIAKVVHEHNMLLLVDEAHGPHLPFVPGLPKSAISRGADLVASSTHKILGALTQGSILFVNEDRVDFKKMAQTAAMLTTTSPNQLIVASLEIAMEQMVKYGKEYFTKLLPLIADLQKGLKKAGFEILEGEDLDPFKLTVRISDFGVSGKKADKILIDKYGVAAELSNLHNLLFLITYADNEETLGILKNSLIDFIKDKEKHGVNMDFPKLPKIPPSKILPRKAFFADFKEVPFKESAGQVSAEEITSYPPGIPLIHPGEVITKEIIKYAKEVHSLGIKLVGFGDHTLETVRVIR